MAKKHIGKCQLTGDVDSLVESHIIPKALTRPEKPGLPFMQGGKGSRPVRRWSSWTDTRLATRKGENILRDLDTWAIRAMRSQKLIWSGIDDGEELPANKVFDEHGRGGREVDSMDWKRFRLFLMSLLWRAAASQISEMSEIIMPDEDIIKLGQLIVSGEPGPIDFYPACLIQISTKGPVHNFTPIASVKRLPLDGLDKPMTEIPIFRFYFEGLVIHFHRHSSDDGLTKDLGPIIVGQEDKLFFPTIPFEVSYQRENLFRVMQETEAQYPEILDRLGAPVRGVSD